MKKLYKRTVTGAVQTWWQEIVGDQYRTHSGQVDGAITTSDFTTVTVKNKGKANESSGEEQAKAEVESNYRRKIKDGYVSTPEEALKSVRFSPMLAKNFEDYAKDIASSTGWSQPKLDGIRCIANKDGLWSRRGDRIVSCPHIEALLVPVFEKVPDLILDGELYNHDLHENFNEITSLVKTTKPSKAHLEKTAAIVQYHVYDANTNDNPGCIKRQSIYMDAIALAKTVSNSLTRPSMIVAVPTLMVNLCEADLDPLYAEYLEAGYEGQMIRLDGKYEQKRSKLLLKRKEFLDSEFEVVRVQEGVGNASGGAKICYLKLDTDPTRIFAADIMGTKEERAELLKNQDKLIGAKATVKYFKQRTPAGIPRFGKVKSFNIDGKW